MTREVDELVKLATVYEERAELEARAWIQVAIGLAMLAAPFISEMVDQVKSSETIPADVDKVLSNLNEYKKSYGFDKYEAQFNEFMLACQNLKDSFNIVTRNTNPADPELLSNIQKFMDSSSKAEQLGFAVKGYLDEMKGFGGKTFDVLKKFKFNLGIDTAATAAGDAIDSLYKHISMSRPKIEASYRELSAKIQGAQQAQQAQQPGTTPVQKTKTPSGSKLEELADITF